MYWMDFKLLTLDPNLKKLEAKVSWVKWVSEMHFKIAPSFYNLKTKDL